MIAKEYGKDLAIEAREEFLRNTCDGTEEVSYSRVFSPEELAKQRELLTDASIRLADIEEEKKQAMADFKEQAKPYAEQRAKAIQNLRTKAETVTEVCYKYFDEETNMVGFYNREGNLVSSRPAFPNEMQKTMFQVLRKEGTNN
jgi:gas vesicle protein